MKKIILTSLFVSASFFSICFSQTKKENILKLMSKDVCDELNKKEISGKTKEELQTELGLAMMPIFSKYLTELKSIYDFEEFDQESGYKIGKDVGMQLAVDCPAFMKLFMNNTEAVSEIAEKRKNKDLKLSGTLLKINNADISFIEIKDNNGKIEKVYWLEYFDGSNTLMNESAKLLNKKITITFTEKEIYKSTLKDYSKIKIITSLKAD